MASKNSRNSRSSARSSRAPQSARAVRSARAAQSGRIAPRDTAEQFSRARNTDPVDASSYRSAYTPGSQSGKANSAYARQSAASQFSRHNPQYAQKASKKMGRGKKIALGVVSALLVVLVGCGTAFALYINSINSELSGNKTQEEMQALQDVLAPKKSFTEPFYMMLIGSDKRAGDEASGARSDTNIVVRIDPTTSLATLVSIPRDTKIQIDGAGTNKFNAAYNYGGASSTIREASELLNVEISHYAEINFEELVELVDVVGGVEVEVDERIDDTDADNTTDNPNGERIIIEEGVQYLNGEQALVFARSRAYADGDFTRTANQRKLISALVSKVLELPVTELPGVIQAAAKCVTTDLSVTDIIALAQQFKEAGDMVMYSAMVPSTTGYIGEVSYVFTDTASLKSMMQVVEEGGDPSLIGASPDAYAQNASANGGTVTNGTTDTYSNQSYDAYSGGNTTYYDPNYNAQGSSTGGENYGYDTGYSDGSYEDTGGGYDEGAYNGTESGYGEGDYAGTGTGEYVEGNEAPVS